MVAPSILLPRTTLNLITSPQRVGLENQRALLVGQLSPGTRASGSVVFTANPSASHTITIGGTAWTFVASGATGPQTNIGASLAATLTALASALNASADANIAKGVYVATPTALIVFAKTAGTDGNAVTLASSNVNAVASAATLTGGAASAATVSAGTLASSIGHTDGDINTLFGSNSHIAKIGRSFRGVNPITNLDALPLADNASAVPATAKITFSGTATRAGTLYVSVASSQDHQYQIDVTAGDTPDDLVSALAARVAEDIWMPFTAVSDGVSGVAFCAVNGGLHANDWLIAVDGTAVGITVTLTGWAGGTSNPSLTSYFNPIANLRYQTIIWPASYTASVVTQFLDARKNVTNRILEGRAIMYQNAALATAKTAALAANSSEVVILNNVPTSTATWIGPHLPEIPEVIAAKFAAVRSRRFETDASVSDIVATNAVRDQFGGLHMGSLPLFNSPLVNVGRPLKGTGYDEISQAEAEAGGVSVVGVNDSNTADITGVIVTTWQYDVSGSPDQTWRYLEWRDTHGIVREYIVENLRKRFRQSRLTNGDITPNFDIANAQLIKGYVVGLCQDLQKQALIQDGHDARQFIEDNLQVILDLSRRQATVNLIYPQVSQLGSIIGTVQYVWQTTSAAVAA